MRNFLKEFGYREDGNLIIDHYEGVFTITILGYNRYVVDVQSRFLFVAFIKMYF